MTDFVLSLLRGAYFGVLAGGFLFFLLWESGAPRRLFADPAARRRHILRNFGCFALVVLIADAFFGSVLLRSWQFVATAPEGLLTRLDLGWPWQLAIGIVVIDLLYYGWHRLAHAVPALWRLHRVHHSDTHLDVTTSSRFHPFEVCISIALVVGVLLVLGIPLWVELARTLIVHPLIMAQHANVAFSGRSEAWLRPFIVTPALHRLHHSVVTVEHDANYGQLFSLWDRWFGTLRHTPSAGAVGVAGFEGDRWQTVRGMLLTPFVSVPAAADRPSAPPLPVRPGAPRH